MPIPNANPNAGTERCYVKVKPNEGARWVRSHPTNPTPQPTGLIYMVAHYVYEVSRTYQ